MFGIGRWELTVMLVVIFILFGHRLPSVMRLLGRGMVEFRRDPEVLQPTSLFDWVVVLLLVGLWIALLFSAMAYRYSYSL